MALAAAGDYQLAGGPAARRRMTAIAEVEICRGVVLVRVMSWTDEGLPLLSAIEWRRGGVQAANVRTFWHRVQIRGNQGRPSNKRCIACELALDGLSAASPISNAAYRMYRVCDGCMTRAAAAWVTANSVPPHGTGPGGSWE